MGVHGSKASSHPPRRSPGDGHWWLLAAAMPRVLCSLKLNLDLGYDEVYTVVGFVARPWREIATDYSAPNIAWLVADSVAGLGSIVTRA